MHRSCVFVRVSLYNNSLLFHFFSIIIPVHYSRSGITSMEGSESETVFDSLKLNPQLFINEILNSVDDIVDGGFEYYLREASNILHVTDVAESAALKKGVAAIKDTIQDPLEKRLQKWAEYCLGNCFSVPEGFVLPKDVCHVGTSGRMIGSAELRGGLYLLGESCPGSSAGNSMHQDELTDIDLDAQIGSLTEKLSLAAKESAEIHKELFALERHTAYSTSCIEAASTVVQPLQEDKAQLFQELLNAASELGNRVEKLQDQTEEELKYIRNEQICNFNINQSSMLIKGLPSTQDKLLQFVDSMKKCNAQPLL